MKLHLYQLQYAVSEKEYETIKNSKMATANLTMDRLVAILTKDIDIGNQATPHIGESINDAYWPSDICEQKVVNVCYSYADSSCTVTLEPFVMVAGGLLHNELEKIASLHGWECQMV